jgi:hypothetical protein
MKNKENKQIEKKSHHTRVKKPQKIKMQINFGYGRNIHLI